jgi:O-antigen ligase
VPAQVPRIPVSAGAGSHLPRCAAARSGTPGVYSGRLSADGVVLCRVASDFVTTKDRIIHSIIMALLVFVSAHELAKPARLRWIHLPLILLAIPNILLLVQGRTGYLLLGLLTMLCLFQQFGRKGLVCAGLLLAVGGWGAYARSSAIRGRVEQTISQFRNQFGPEKKRSYDARLEFYEHALKMIRQHPLVGTGTGSFHVEYSKVVAGTGLPSTPDPHNEYLLLAAQGGIPAVGLFVAILIMMWRGASRLPAWEARIGRGIVVTVAAGSLFNSLILSVTGGLLWSYFGALAFADLGSADAAAEEESSQPPLPGATSPARLAA